MSRMFCGLVLSAWTVVAFAQDGSWQHQFKTDWSRKSVDLKEILSGGPRKDGIPSIDNPRLTTVTKADKWISGREPVIVLALEAGVRIYPLQILTWHEIVNDQVGDVPVTVTFCPLCYSAIAFDRRLDGKTLDFGVSGLLRHSDMIMFDRQTESFWQQAIGEAIIGEWTGRRLKMLPAALIAWSKARDQYPQAQVLSRDTGHARDYGRNPYAGYDDIAKTPMLLAAEVPGKTPPMEHLATVEIEGKAVAYAYSHLRKKRVVNDLVVSTPITVFFETATGTALGESDLSEARRIGATAVFDRRIDDRTLNFEWADGRFRDQETESSWNIFGQAVDGPLKGRALQRLVSGDFFAFAWLVFRPDAQVRTP